LTFKTCWTILSSLILYSTIVILCNWPVFIILYCWLYKIMFHFYGSVSNLYVTCKMVVIHNLNVYISFSNYESMFHMIWIQCMFNLVIYCVKIICWWYENCINSVQYSIGVYSTDMRLIWIVVSTSVVLYLQVDIPNIWLVLSMLETSIKCCKHPYERL
jgi:hypothetical protein